MRFIIERRPSLVSCLDLQFNYTAPIGERSIVMSVCVCVCVCVCVSAILSSELHVRSSPNFLCMLPRPWPWLGPPVAEAQRTHSLGLGYKLCAVIPVAG